MFERITKQKVLLFLVLAWSGIILFNYFNLDDKVSQASNKLLLASNSFIPPPPVEDHEPLTVAGIIKETNKYRAQGGLVALRSNDLLTNAAVAKADDMFKNSYFAHISKTGQGPDDFAKEAKYEYILVGENLALGIFKDDADVLNSWMNSPGHRENIMHQGYTEIGVAVKEGIYEGKKVWMAVQEFGTPLSACGNFNDSREILIKSYKKQLDNLRSVIDDKELELSQISKDSPEYNTGVNVYNKLVGEYNDLSARTKKLLVVYNSEAEAYNNCMDAFQD